MIPSFLPGTGRGTVRRTVEGPPLPARGDDGCDHSVQVAQDLGGGNTQGKEAELRKMLIPAGVTLWAIAACMPFSVHFNREPRLEAGEIEPVGRLRMLAAKLEAGRPLAKRLP